MAGESNITVKDNNTVKKKNSDSRVKDYSFLKVRVRPEDIEIYKSRALENRMTMAEYVRRVLSNTPLNVRELNSYARTLVYEIQKIGNNINQIAKAVNVEGQLSEADRHYIVSVMRRLMELVTDAVKAVKGEADGDK